MTTNNKQTIIDRLLKVKELAVRGVDGEQAAAKKLLEETMRRYGITEEDLGGGSIRMLYYTTISQDEFDLIWWLLKRVWYEYRTDHIKNHYGSIMTILPSSVGLKLSIEEHAELSALYEHYRAGLARSIDNLEKNYRAKLAEIKTDLADRKKEYIAYVKRREDQRNKLRKDHRKARKNIGTAYISKNNLYINNEPEQAVKIGHPDTDKPRKATKRGFYSDLGYLDMVYESAELSGPPNQLPALRIGEEEP